MRSILRLLSLLLFIGGAFSASAQTQRPQFRPAVLGSGPDSLINRIDVKELQKKGQKDGAVMFCAIVAPNGEAEAAWTYHAMPETTALEEELNKRLEHVKFTAPIYNYQPVKVLLYGTAVFSALNTPHILILLNQDARELKETNDFIAPQPVIGADSKFRGLDPSGSGSSVPLTAVVDLGLKVSADGQLQEMRVLREEPPLLGYGDAAESNFQGAKFIPAFRAGDPAACDIVQPVCYKPAE